MRLYIKILILTLTYLPFANGVHANLPELSLTECLGRVEKGSVQIAQNILLVASSAASLKETQSQKLPQLLGQAVLYKTYDIYSQSPDANKVVLRVEQNAFPFLGPTWALTAQKEKNLETSELAKIETEQDVRLLVKQLYFSILRDRETIERIKTLEHAFTNLLDTSLPRYNFGSTHSFDVVKIKSTKYDFYRTRSLIEAQLVLSESQLSQIISLPRTELKIKPLSRIPALPEIQKIKTLAEGNNPTLLLNAKQIESSELLVKASKAQRIPSVTAFYELGSFGQTLNSMSRGWDIGVQLKLSIFDWGLIRSQVSQSQAQVQLSQRKMQAETERIRAELEQGYAFAQAHLNDRNNLSAILPEVKKTALNSRERYRNAGVGILELTDSINLWLQTEINERSAFYSYLTDLAKLDRTSGEKLETIFE